MDTEQIINILVIHGPNMNLLGRREPDIYGYKTLAQLNAELVEAGVLLGAHVETYQSNHEGDLIDRIHEAIDQDFGYLIVNAGGYTHTSVALHDALKASKTLGLPYVEVHISNPQAREEYRHQSFLSEEADGVVCGLGVQGYHFALEHAAAALHWSKNRNAGAA